MSNTPEMPVNRNDRVIGQKYRVRRANNLKSFVEVELLAPNIGKHTCRSGNADYWLECNKLGLDNGWCFAFEERFNKLVKRYGSIEELSAKHISNEGKKQVDPTDPLVANAPKATRVRKMKAGDELDADPTEAPVQVKAKAKRIRNRKKKTDTEPAEDLKTKFVVETAEAEVEDIPCPF